LTAFVAGTHGLVWHLTEPRRLAQGARWAFAAADAGRWPCDVPAIVLVEVSLLGERGRLRMELPQFVEALAGHAGYAILPLDVEQALAFASLVSIRDPMVRLVVAAERATGARLVSSDKTLSGHGVERVWD